MRTGSTSRVRYATEADRSGQRAASEKGKRRADGEKAIEVYDRMGGALAIAVRGGAEESSRARRRVDAYLEEIRALLCLPRGDR